MSESEKLWQAAVAFLKQHGRMPTEARLSPRDTAMLLNEVPIEQRYARSDGIIGFVYGMTILEDAANTGEVILS